jgi:large conductance mechanosensitive channel
LAKPVAEQSRSGLAGWLGETQEWDRMLKEFKEFALKGNMVDLAIGVIIGGAFGGLVNSMVEDILMPIIGLVTGGVDFSNLFIQLAGAPATTLAAAKEAGATLAYGNFITLLINFLIIAWVLFMVVKAMNKMKKAEPAPAPAAPPADVVLLGEIRDLLKK